MLDNGQAISAIGVGVTANMMLFKQFKESLLHLALPDPDRPFSVVSDASDFAIGSALLQTDVDGRERVIAFESQQLKADPLFTLRRNRSLIMKLILALVARSHWCSTARIDPLTFIREGSLAATPNYIRRRMCSCHGCCSASA